MQIACQWPYVTFARRKAMAASERDQQHFRGARGSNSGSFEPIVADGSGRSSLGSAESDSGSLEPIVATVAGRPSSFLRRSFVVPSSLQPRTLGSRPPNGLTLSCAAKAHVPKFARRDGCHVRAAARRERMSAGVTPATLAFNEALQRRTGAGPHQLQRGVSRLLSRCGCFIRFMNLRLPRRQSR